jgi:hypothetical protein
VKLRLQCDVCGARSAPVDEEPSGRDRQMLAEFRALHDGCAGVAGDTVSAWPEGYVFPQGGPFGSPKPPTHSTPRPHGHFERTGPYGELETGDLLSCCHCRHFWEVRVGSGRTRGFCALCHDGRPGTGYTCGRPECDAHVPYEVRLENVEAGRHPLTPPPALAAVPELPTGFAGAVVVSTSEVSYGPEGA